MSEPTQEQKQTAQPAQEHSPQLTPEEQEIISVLEKTYGRKLTQQEIHLSLNQARAIGEL